MGRKELAAEIADFCTQYQLMERPQDTIIKRHSIEKHLEYSWFVNYLIHKLITKAKYIKDMDHQRLEKLIAELEKVRSDLEYD